MTTSTLAQSVALECAANNLASARAHLLEVLQQSGLLDSTGCLYFVWDGLCYIKPAQGVMFAWSQFGEWRSDRRVAVEEILLNPKCRVITPAEADAMQERADVLA